MNRNEFLQEMDRLVDVFPSAYKSAGRMDLIWRAVGSLDKDAFGRIVDKLVGSSRHAPMVPDFEDLAAIERELAWAKRKKLPQNENWNVKYNCDHCRDNGAYLAHRGDFSPYAFRCHCERGQSDPRVQIPYFVQSHKDEGFIYLTVDELKIARAKQVELLGVSDARGA